MVTAGYIAGFVSEEAAAKCSLKPGTPVAGGMFDIDACAIAVGVLDEKNPEAVCNVRNGGLKSAYRIAADLWQLSDEQ